MIRVLLFVLTCSFGAQYSNAEGELCLLHESCGKCLTANSICSWCIDPNYDMLKPRCGTSARLKALNCKEIYDNTPMLIEIKQNVSTHDFAKDSLDAIQIQPQNVKITMKRGQTQKFQLKFRPAKNYPLDLYYLMDLTWSMQEHKEMLFRVGNDLALTLEKLTENYLIGFGSFVDKPAMPFAPMGKEKDNPCALAGDHSHVCEKTYGFRHQQLLTSNVVEFKEKVNASAVSANYDNLEGGLDALMQAIVCQERIGWRNQSRKIVILATDGLIHFAGDGKLAGVVKKNDKKCYLDENGDYTASLEMDYPSLEEIYRELLRRKVNVYFAIRGSGNTIGQMKNYYEQLHKLTEEITELGVIEEDSSNILQMVSDGYHEFVKRIQFFDNAPANLQVTYETRCGKEFFSAREQSKCENVEMGEEYEFTISVTALEYPEDGARQQTFRIEETSTSSEYMEVEINIEDDCPCLLADDGQANSPICNLHGKLSCGMCLCDSGFSGKTCDCDLLDYSSSKELDQKCRLPITDRNNFTTLGAICSDRGECSCGTCYCNAGYSGEFCDCFECPYFQGTVCGGSERAYCDCGECKCHDGWSGERCDCQTSQAPCIAPNSETICSGHGTCECASCKCESNFYGSFCEMTSTAVNALCLYYEPCVSCLLDRNEFNNCTDLEERCMAKDGTKFYYEFVDDISQSKVQCTIRFTTGEGVQCDKKFTYRINELSESSLLVLRSECKKGLSVGSVFAITIVTTVVLGILLILLIKLVNYTRDKREFARFEEEKNKHTEYSLQSPIYNSPIRTYQMPAELSGSAFEMNRLSAMSTTSN